MTPDEFYAMTPVYFKSLCRCFRYRKENEEFMQALAISWNVNTSMCRPATPFKPEDFMPSRWGLKKPERKARKVRMTKKRHQELIVKWRAAFAARGVGPNAQN